MSTFDDELDQPLNSEVASPASKAEAAETPYTSTSAANAAEAVKAGDEVDLIADHEELKAKQGLSNIAPKEAGKGVRCALLNVKAYQGWTHFLSGGGAGNGITVRCPGSGCPECAKGGEHSPRRKIVALAIRYETDGDGRFPKGTTKPAVSIGYVALSPTAYTELSNCPSEEEGESLYTIDFRMAKKANGIGFTFSRMSSPPAFVKAGMEAEIAELVKPYADGQLLRSRIGKTVTVLEMRGMLSGSLLDTSPSMADLERVY